MNTKVKIVRVNWGNINFGLIEIPIVPIFPNQIVYVWGEENNRVLKSRGYKTKLMPPLDDDIYSEYNGRFIRKLIALDLALKEYGEVILLDWDCYILRELDETFYNYLKEKPIQCPIYGQFERVSESCVESDPNINENDLNFVKLLDTTFKQYSWKYEDVYGSPNFSCVYSRDVNFGKDLLDITLKHKILGCIEEHAMWVYANCTMEEYMKRYQPKFLLGVSNQVVQHSNLAQTARKKINDYVESHVPMDIYLEHI